MTVVYADETLRLLADVAASFATRDADRVRALRDAGGLVDREMWQRLAANGWLSILVDEDLDGAGLGLDAVAIVARRLGYAGFPEPFVAAGVLAPLVLAAARDEQRLAAVLSGASLVGVGWQRQAVAHADGGRCVLDGTSRFIGLSAADGYAVVAHGAGGVGLYWVDGEAAAAVTTGERSADGTLSARLDLEATPATPLVAPEDAEPVLDAVDTALIAVSAELLGVMDAALELTLAYLGERKQFGRPIGSFQALQHRAVDAWMQRELASAALDAAVRVHMDPESSSHARAAAASSAKARAAIGASVVCRTAVQLHGAIGYTDEYDLGMYVNRMLTLAPWLGNAAEHTRRRADLLDAVERAR